MAESKAALQATGSQDHLADLALLEAVAEEAGKIAMAFFTGANAVWHKSGNSPVSEADLAVDQFLAEQLKAARPDYGWLSEESADHPDRLNASRVFIVDPIDGTRGFVEGKHQWCISMAVVEDGVPVAGVLECPALGERFAAARGRGATLNDAPLSLAQKNTRISTVTASRKLNTAMIEHIGDRVEILPFVPSLAYRLAMVASGRLDGAFARPGAHDWDLAAAQVIIEEAQGVLADEHGNPPLYNSKTPRHGTLFCAARQKMNALIQLAKSGGFLH